MPKIHSHYENLKVARNAPDAVIRAAYRVLAQQYHPDVNATPEAARIMAMLNTAWHTLGDPTRRAQHDAWLEQAEKETEAKGGPAPGAQSPRPPAPPPASAPPAPPPATHEPQPGPRPSEEYSPLNLTAKIMAGFVLGVSALIYVLTDKADSWVNKQSYSPPYSTSRPADAQVDVTAPAPPPPLPFEIATQRAANEQGGDDPFADLSPKGAPKQVADTRPVDRVPSADEFLADVSEDSPAAAGRPMQVRWSPNGKAWPSRASYLPGFARKAGGGLSKVTIDNSSGGSDVYVKLCNAGLDTCTGLRHVFIPRGGQFSMAGLASGEYDIRYRDLSTGYLSKSEPMQLQQIEEADGVRYSVVTLTLYTVSGGNMDFKRLSEDQF